MGKEIFALDIGTRKVMGLVAVKNEEFVEILDVEVIEHASRPMFDGQIHSIEEVARTVKKIKDTLEFRLNIRLEQVGVAVAGRSLTTYKSKVSKKFDTGQEVAADMVRDLELEAVDKIITDSGKDLTQFYCVGYSPVCYELDGNKISNLIGHKAQSIAVEVIVTFLPRVVLDSMFAVLKKAGLKPTNITLEPISAIKAIIPPEMRNLNIILVDIGAGTSDLALTKDGSIVAYGMVPVAGDEVTERISEILLTDFSTAEKIKRSLNDKEIIEYEDIWSRHHQIDIHNLSQLVLPAVKKLTQSIAKAGLELNEGAPQAVVIVGGGSLTFNLIGELAQDFGLSEDKVGIRLPHTVKGIRDRTRKLTGPEAVTPIGIALMTAESLGIRFINIEINGEKFKILDFQQKKDVMGALTLSGIVNKKRLYPRPGMALTGEVNGELKIIKGTLGEPAQILLNGNPISSLSDKIEDGDVLEFKEALDGQDASALVSDLLQVSPLNIIFNQEPVSIMPPIVMGDEEVGLDARVSDRAEIRIDSLKIKDALKFKEVNTDNLSQRQILVNINGVPKILTQRNFTLSLNNQSADLDTELKNCDTLEFHFDNPTSYRIKDVINVPEGEDHIHINVDGSDLDVKLYMAQIFMNGHPVKPEEFIIDGADIRVYSLSKKQILLSEIFRYIDLDPQRAVGKSMKILVDDKPAGFTTLLTEGSRVRIIFEERARAGEA